MRSFCPLPYYISIEEKGKNLGGVEEKYFIIYFPNRY
jgi:hypothetical protein